MSYLNTLEFAGLRMKPIGYVVEPGIGVKNEVYGKAPDPRGIPGCSIYLTVFLGSLAAVRYRDSDVTLTRKVTA